MDRGMVIFIGALLTFSSSWLGLVIYPFAQLNDEQPYQKDEGDEAYPQPLSGLARAGKTVYQNNGCLYCHSQQVRGETFGCWWSIHGERQTGADQKRSYGIRRTVSRDYIFDNPTMLGTSRTGPDLANIGVRSPSSMWHHNHLFNPRSANEWSIMPSFSFLYTRNAIVGGRSLKALFLGREWTVKPGYRWRPSPHEWAAILDRHGDALASQYSAGSDEVINISTDEGRQKLLNFWLTTPEEDYQVIPNADGEALVAYLLSLRKAEVPLPEAKE